MKDWQPVPSLRDSIGVSPFPGTSVPSFPMVAAPRLSNEAVSLSPAFVAGRARRC